MPTVQDLANLCRRVGLRLEGEPFTRQALLDMATVLMFVAHWLDLALAGLTPEPGSPGVDRARASGLLTVMRDSLRWVRARRESASTADIHDQLRLALGSASQLLAILESHGS